LTSLTDARLGALLSEAAPALQRRLERLQSDRSRIQARYLAGRVASIAVVVGGYSLWLQALRAPFETAALWGGLGLVVLTAILEGAATAGRRAADWVVPVAARYLYPLELLVWPLALVSHALGRVIRPWGRRQIDPRVAEAEVELMVDQGAASGVLDRGNAEMIRKVLEFPELVARDAMIPRKQVVAIRLDTPLEEVVEIVTSAGHSRYPVYREGIDDVFGLLYAKDLFRVLKPMWQAESGPTPSVRRDSDGDGHAESDPPVSSDTPSRRIERLRDIVREPAKIVTESRPLSELLREMRQDRQHMAIVVDEYGGTSGIVTLEDVIEEIVGDIRDEHDEDNAPIVALPDGRLLVDAAVLICDLSSYLGWNLDPDDEYDSLAGMITDKLGDVPAVGARLRAHGVELIVRDADEKHVTKVEIVPMATLAPAAPPSPDDTGEALKVG
jgi:CBS domain containing-hemolysin-like protein